MFSKSLVLLDFSFKFLGTDVELDGEFVNFLLSSRLTETVILSLDIFKFVSMSASQIIDGIFVLLDLQLEDVDVTTSSSQTLEFSILFL